MSDDTPRRGPRLVRHNEHAWSWEWPTDPVNVAEDERIAEIYHQQRLRERAIYEAKRAEYLRAVADRDVADAIHACANCGATVYGGDAYCSPDCMSEAENYPLDVAGTVMGRPMGRYLTSALCSVCGNPVGTSRQGQARIYCSPKCRNKARIRRHRGQSIQNKKRKTA